MSNTTKHDSQFAFERIPVRKQVKLCLLWKLWAHRKNIILLDLGFVVWLLVVKLHQHPQHYVLIWKRWLTGDCKGGIEKYTPSDMCWSNQGAQGGWQPLKGRERRERRPPGCLPISSWSTAGRFRPKNTHILQPQPVKGSEEDSWETDKKRKEKRKVKIWWRRVTQSDPGDFFFLFIWPCRSVDLVRKKTSGLCVSVLKIQTIQTRHDLTDVNRAI